MPRKANAQTLPVEHEMNAVADIKKNNLITFRPLGSAFFKMPKENRADSGKGAHYRTSNHKEFVSHKWVAFYCF